MAWFDRNNRREAELSASCLSSGNVTRRPAETHRLGKEAGPVNENAASNEGGPRGSALTLHHSFGHC
jgi:hypothetical protein